MLKKFSLDKVSGTKNVKFLEVSEISRATGNCFFTNGRLIIAWIIDHNSSCL